MSKGRLSREGTLEISRKGRYFSMQCRQLEGHRVCNHYCPLMSEPDGNTLAICHGKVHTFDEFEDLRIGA